MPTLRRRRFAALPKSPYDIFAAHVFASLTRQNPPVSFLFQKETAGLYAKIICKRIQRPLRPAMSFPAGEKTFCQEKLPVLFLRDGKLPFPGHAPPLKYPQTAQENLGKTAVRRLPHISCAHGLISKSHQSGSLYRAYHTPFPAKMQQYFSFFAPRFPILALHFQKNFSKMENRTLYHLEVTVCESKCSFLCFSGNCSCTYGIPSYRHGLWLYAPGHWL